MTRLFPLELRPAVAAAAVFQKGKCPSTRAAGKWHQALVCPVVQMLHHPRPAQMLHHQVRLHALACACTPDALPAHLYNLPFSGSLFPFNSK
eukprot:scaffold190799_cov18-Tisochrysis_lutea.AAC.1